MSSATRPSLVADSVVAAPRQSGRGVRTGDVLALDGAPNSLEGRFPSKLVHGIAAPVELPGTRHSIFGTVSSTAT